MSSIPLAAILATICPCGQTRPAGAVRCDACEYKASQQRYLEAKRKEAK